MPQYAENPQTGERFWLNPESNSWEALQKAENKQTGESFVLWHDEWVPEKTKIKMVASHGEAQEKAKPEPEPLERVPPTPMVESGRPQIQGAGIMRSEQSKQKYISGLQSQLVDAQTFGDRSKASDLRGRIKVAYESQMAEQPDVFDEALQKERGITDEPAGPAPQSLEQAQMFDRMGAKNYRVFMPEREGLRRTLIESMREHARLTKEIEQLEKPDRNIIEQGVGSLTSGMYNLAGGVGELLNDLILNNIETYWNSATTKARAALTGDRDSKKQLNDWAGQLFDKKGEAYEALWSTKLKRKQEESRETLEKESVQAEPLLVEYEKGKYKANWEAFRDPKFYVKVTIENAPQLALSAATGAKAFVASINAGMTEAQAISAAAKAAGSVEAAQIFTDSYNELRSRGLDQFRAFSGATIAAGIGYGVSRGIPGMGGLVKRAAGKNILIRKGAQVLEEGFEGAFFENLVKSRKAPVRMMAGATAEGGDEALQTVGEIAGQAAAEGKMPTATEAGAKIAGATVGGATLGGLMSARRLRGDGSWTDAERQAVMERLQAGFGATPKASPVEQVKVQIQGIDAELNDLKANGGNQKRIELLERKKAVMESAIAGLPGSEETTVVSEVAAPLALTDEDLSLEIFNTDNTLSNFDPSQKLEDTFETLRSEADLAALEYQEVERSLAPVIRSGETQYATEEEVAAGLEAQQRLVAARRERDNILRAVRKRLESVVNPMAEKEYNEAYETGMLKPESGMLPDVEFQAPLATVPVRIRTESGIEQTDLTGDLATEYQEEEANHNALVDQIRNSRGYTSSERAAALKEEGERFRRVKMGIIERANQVAPTAVEPTIEQGVEDVGPQGSAVETGTAPEPGPGIPVGGEVEATGEVRPEAGEGATGDVARWFARVGGAFPEIADDVAAAIERGGEVSITENAEGNPVYTLRYQVPFVDVPAYWIMVDAETPVYINTMQYVDDATDGDTLRVLYVKAKDAGKKVAHKAYRQAAQAAIEDGLVIDTLSAITVSHGSFLSLLTYASSAFRTGDSVMTTDINDVLTDNFDPTYDREIAKQAFTAHKDGHNAVADNLIDQSKAGIDTVYGQAFESQPGTWENTKQALRNMTRGGMAESLGLQSIYDLVAAIVKDLGVLAKNGYLANREKIAAWLAQNGNGVTIEAMSQAVGSEEALASIFDQKVVINPARAFETVDSILEASGVKSLSGRIGFYATPEDGIAAATEAIGGLGNTQTQTAAKIRAKWRDIPPAIAVRIASQLHTFHTPSAPTPLELESKSNPEDSAEREVVATAKAVDKGIDEPIGSELLKTTVPMGQVGQRMPNEQALNELRDRTFKGRFRKTMFQIAGKAPLAAIASPVSYAMRSPLMGNLRRSIRQFVAEINKVKFSQRDLLHELLTLARDPEKNNRLGLALGLASYRPYTDKKGRKKVGKMFSREELAVLFPDMTPEERGLYYRVSLAMRQLTTDRMRALEVQRKANEQTAAERLASPETTASQRKAILKELVSYRRAFGERMRNLGNQGYWPSSRYGNFMWRAYDQNENQIAVVFTDEDGENGAAQAVEKLKYAALQSGVVQSAIDNGTVRWNIKSPDGMPYPLPKLTDDVRGEGGLPFDLSTAKWTLQAQRLGEAIGLSDEAGTALELAISQTYLKDSIRAHEQYRTGEPGWETDALRVFQNHVSIVANEIANNKHAKEISDALEKLSFNKLGQQYDPVLEEEARKQVRAAKAPPYIPNWSQYLLTLGYVYQLGGVVSVAAQQLAQIPTVGWITLGNFYGGAQAGKAYGAGLRVAASMVDWLSLEDFSGKSRMYIKGRIDRMITWDKLRWFAGTMTKQQQDDYVTAVRNALMRAFDTGSLQPKMSAEMLQAEMRPGPTQTAADIGVETLGYVMNKFERVNRIATVVASAMLASKHGAVKFYGQNGGWALEKVDLSTTEGAEEIAATSEEFNASINFTGGRGDLAPYQRIGGKAGAFSRPMFQFTRFPLDFFVLMHNLGLSNWRKADAAGKSRIWAYAKPQLKGLVVTSILAGPSAYWLIAMINALLSSLGAEDEMRELEDDSRLWLRGHFAKIGESIYPGDATKAADFAAKAVFSLEHGLPNMAGVDIHNSLKFQLIQAPNGAGILSTIGYKAAGPFAGPLIDTIETAGKSNWEIQWKTGRKLVPRVARNLTDAIAGNVTIEGQPEDLTYYERALKAMSFTTTKEGRIYQQSGVKFDLDEDRKKTINEGKVKSDKINALQLKYEAATTDAEKRKIDAEMQRLSEEKNKIREEWNTRNMRFIERGLARRIKAAEMRKRSSYGRRSNESYKINAGIPLENE